MNITDKPVVLITGSTSGIGQGLAEYLHTKQYLIALNGFGVAQHIKDLSNDLNAFYHPADMTKPDEIGDMIGAVHNHFGRLDAVINNAGVQHVAAVQDFPADQWNRIIDINLSAVFHTTHHAIPIMKHAGRGRIINIASAHGLVASPFKSAYVAAKHGVVGFTKSVALEVAQDNITVNAICPGYVKTPLVEGQIKDQAKARNMTEDDVMRDVILAAQPTKAFVEIDQIGGMVDYILSDAGASVNGAALTIDGGWTAQ